MTHLRIKIRESQPGTLGGKDAEEGSVIRHTVINEGESIRQVAREMGVSRNTVRRCLRGSEAVRGEKDLRPNRFIYTLPLMPSGSHTARLDAGMGFVGMGA